MSEHQGEFDRLVPDLLEAYGELKARVEALEEQVRVQEDRWEATISYFKVVNYHLKGPSQDTRHEAGDENPLDQQTYLKATNAFLERTGGG